MIRKEQKALMTSGYLTLRDKIIRSYYKDETGHDVPIQPYPLGHPRCPAKAHGGITSPDHIELPNGSVIFFRGLDDPTKVLSAEYDFIYVCQAEELALEDWEQLLGRCTGRAGNAPYPQVLGDCNPADPNHWILHRKTLELYQQLHHHNPFLCDVDEDDVENSAKWNWTDQGKRSLRVLDNYSGLLYQKARLGEWVAPQGMVFRDFRREIHVLPGEGRTIPDHWMRFRSIDFGFNDAFVCQWWAVDEEGIMYLYREIYKTKLFIQDAAVWINELSEGEDILYTVCDHDAGDRAYLDERALIHTEPAFKDIRFNIELVQERLRVQEDANGDKRARIYFFDNALVEPDEELVNAFRPHRTYQSINNLRYPTKKSGTHRDEEPVNKDKDGYDATAYAVAFLDADMMHSKDFHYGKINVPPNPETLEASAGRADRSKVRFRGSVR